MRPDVRLLADGICNLSSPSIGTAMRIPVSHLGFGPFCAWPVSLDAEAMDRPPCAALTDAQVTTVTRRQGRPILVRRKYIPTLLQPTWLLHTLLAQEKDGLSTKDQSSFQLKSYTTQCDCCCRSLCRWNRGEECRRTSLSCPSLRWFGPKFWGCGAS